MEEHLRFVQSYIANVEGIYDFAFADPNSAIISDSCDCEGGVGADIHPTLSCACVLFYCNFLADFPY